MDFLNNIFNSFDNLSKFLFSTYTGIAILIILVLSLSLLTAFILEIKTKNKWKNHPLEEDDTDEQ